MERNLVNAFISILEEPDIWDSFNDAVEGEFYLPDLGESTYDDDDEDEFYEDEDSPKLKNIRTFRQGGFLTMNEGFVITLDDGTEYQFTCVRSK